MRIHSILQAEIYEQWVATVIHNIATVTYSTNFYAASCVPL